VQSRFQFHFPLDGVAAPLCFGEPREILCAETVAEVRDVVRLAEARARSGAWVAGMVGYEAAPAFDPAMRVCEGNQLPLAWFGVFDSPLAGEHGSSRPASAAISGPWIPDVDQERFDQDIAAVRKAIFDGKVYQVNYTLRLRSRWRGNELELYRQLQDAQPGGYSAYLDLGRFRILSISPELFFRREGAILTTRPMKGTAKRGRWAEEDRQAADWLRNSDKNRAENLMIVDLLRNDLARVAKPHGVSVPELFTIERYPTLFQMTSTVKAELRHGVGLEDIFAALFPCGSITGAPKIKAMEIIAQLENRPRGAYCGAIGLLRPGGDTIFNVAIRTVTVDTANDTDATATCGVGGGIVWDSSAQDEYSEALLKSKFLRAEPPDFQLLETLRLESGRFIRLDRHLARLAASAHYFGRPFDEAQLRRKLDIVAAEQRGKSARIGIRCDARGAIAIAVASVPGHSSQGEKFCLANTSVSRDSIWLYHKTSRRGIYDRALAAHPDVFDVLLWNEQRQLTEFTRGNLLLEIGGKKLTPPLSCGLLNGCLRSEMLEAGEIVEAVLNIDDLARAQRVWFINSLRGCIEMQQPALQRATERDQPGTPARALG
jgi:para-aminobenzoate synthetase / 4-amino-4-deoxychorismate lyase